MNACTVECILNALVAEMSCAVVAFFGAFLLVVGVLFAVLNLALTALNVLSKQNIKMIGISQLECMQTATVLRVRLQLGGFTALGLGVLVVADVLESLAKGVHEQTYDTLGKMSVIAVFRTVLAYFLAKEMKDVEGEIEHEEHKLHGHGDAHDHAHDETHHAEGDEHHHKAE